MRSVAIIGKCSSTRQDAPILDTRWEMWGLAWDVLARHDRMFEIHANWRNFLGNEEDAAAHRRWLQSQLCPVYMRKAEEDIPNSVAYPFEAIGDLIGRNVVNNGPYIESSIAFMMALAIYESVHPAFGGEPVGRIGIWGVDMHVETEYGYQRPNMEYLIGFARGKGIKVWTPPQSALLTPAHEKAYGIWTVDDVGAPQTEDRGPKARAA